MNFLKRIACALIGQIACSSHINAQIQIGSSDNPISHRAGRITAEHFAMLKKTTTIFCLQNQDVANIKDFENCISKVWTLTPFKIVLRRDINEYLNSSAYSIFDFSAFETDRQGPASYSVNQFAYELYIRPPREGRTEKVVFSRILMAPYMSGADQIVSSTRMFAAKRDKEENRAVVAEQSKRNAYANWGAGYLKAYVKFVNDVLSTRKTQGMTEVLIDRKQLKQLTIDTLYIVNYHIAEKTRERLLKKYPFPVQFIDEVALNEKIVAATEPIYYLFNIQTANSKFIDVVEGNSGTLIYNVYHYPDYANGITEKDMKQLANEID